MKTQDDKYLKKIEDLSIKTESLASGIKMEDIKVKNYIIRTLRDISDNTMNDTIIYKAKEQLDKITTIPHIANYSEKRFANSVTYAD